MDYDIYRDLIIDEYYSNYDEKIAPGNLERYRDELLEKQDPRDTLGDLIEIFPSEDYKYNPYLAKILEYAKEAIKYEISTDKDIANFLQLTYERVDEL